MTTHGPGSAAVPACTVAAVLSVQLGAALSVGLISAVGPDRTEGSGALT